jgi:hypothetical protein
MKPGPTTAKNSRSRNFQVLRNFMRTGHRHDQIGQNRTIRINAECDLWIDESAKARNFCAKVANAAKEAADILGMRCLSRLCCEGESRVAAP